MTSSSPPPSSLSGTALLPNVSSLFFQNPPPTFQNILSPDTPSQLFGTGPQHPPPFQHRSAKQDQMKGLCSVLFGRIESLRSVNGQIGSNEGPRFGSVWPNNVGREEGANGRRGPVPKSRRGIGREPVPGSRGGCRTSMCQGVEERCWGRGKGEKTEGRGAVPGRGKETMPKRRRKEDEARGSVARRGGVGRGKRRQGCVGRRWEGEVQREKGEGSLGFFLNERKGCGEQYV